MRGRWKGCTLYCTLYCTRWVSFSNFPFQVLSVLFTKPTDSSRERERERERQKGDREA